MYLVSQSLLLLLLQVPDDEGLTRSDDSHCRLRSHGSTGSLVYFLWNDLNCENPVRVVVDAVVVMVRKSWRYCCYS
jgi:hypothetical protein